MSVTFTGAIFKVQSVVQTGPASLRVRFTQDPKHVTSAAGNDGLNPANYTLSGPLHNSVNKVVAASDDPQALDLYLAQPLAVGAWSLTVSGVVEDTLTALTAPTSAAFAVTQIGAQSTLQSGAIDDDTIAVLRKFLNPTLKGPSWNSVIAGLAAGIGPEWDNARLAFDQLYIGSASGAYLDKRASDVGQVQPPGVGLSDDLFRQLVITSKTRKLTQEAVLEVLEVFYGQDALRASSTTDLAEPYNLSDQDDLTVLIDEKFTATVTFERSNFAQIGVASALEVAMAITRALKVADSQAFAEEFTDPTTGLNYVRIYSGSLGLSSSVRVTGGRGQANLHFPQSLFTTSGSSPFAVWSLSASPTTIGNIRFTESSGIYDLFNLQEGDLAYVYGPEFVASGCHGTFRVESVSVSYSGSTKIQWFEIANPLGVGVGSVTQTLFNDLMFFRPVRRTIYDQPRHVIVAQAGKAVDVVIPATTQAVERTPSDAAYLKAQPAVVIDLAIRTPDGTVTVTTHVPHGLSVGDVIIIDEMVPTGGSAPVDAGTASGDFSSNVATGVTDASLATTVSDAHTFQGVYHKIARTGESLLVILGGRTITGGVPTPIANPVVLEITSETVDGNGGRKQNYKWTNLASVTNHIGSRAFGLSVSSLNGKILTTGGTDGDDTTGTPKNNWDMLVHTNAPPSTVQTTGTMPAAIVAHGQCSLGVYGELTCGGWTVPGTALATAHLFDTTASAWTARASMRYPRMYHGAVTIVGNLALIMGGQVGGVALNSCEIYDPGANTWTATCPMTFARYAFEVVTLPDGRVIAIGGTGYNATQSATPVALNSCEIFDPHTRLWSNLPSMSVARAAPAVAYIPTKNILMVTGSGSSAIDILDLGTMRWKRSLSTLADS